MSERRIPRFPDEREVDMWRLNIDKNLLKPHAVLSPIHSDTIVAAPVSGDLIYANNTSKWTRLPKGNEGQLLKMVDGYPIWSTHSTAQFILVAADGSGQYTTISAAVASLNNAPGVIYIKAGVYNAETFPILLSTGQKLIGDGSESVFLIGDDKSYSSHTGMIQSKPDSNTELSGIWISGMTINGKDCTSSNLHGIYLPPSRGFRCVSATNGLVYTPGGTGACSTNLFVKRDNNVINDVHIWNTKGRGIYSRTFGEVKMYNVIADQCRSSGFYFDNYSHPWLLHCVAEACGRDDITGDNNGITVDNTTGLWLNSCYINNNKHSGVYAHLIGDSHSSMFSFSNSVFGSSHCIYGINISGVHILNIGNCNFEGEVTHHIQLNACYDVTICGNSFHELASGSTTAINLTGCIRTSVTGNTFRDSVPRVFYITGGDSIFVSSNATNVNTIFSWGSSYPTRSTFIFYSNLNNRTSLITINQNGYIHQVNLTGQSYASTELSLYQMSALTGTDYSTVDDTYGVEERDVISNLRTRLSQLESRLQSAGLLSY